MGNILNMARNTIRGLERRTRIGGILMESQEIGSRHIVRIDKGEEIVESLNRFCAEKGITAGTVQGLGATGKAVIGWFEPATRKYHSTSLSGDYEIVSLLGNITTMDGKPYLHIHACLAGKDQKVIGGHLSSAVVSATFEGFIDDWKGMACRKFSNQDGLNLLSFGR